MTVEFRIRFVDGGADAAASVYVDGQYVGFVIENPESPDRMGGPIAAWGDNQSLMIDVYRWMQGWFR